MQKFAIITDSCSDLSKELREKNEIDYVQMNIVLDEKELPASLDWDIYTPRVMYDWMREGKVLKTTQVPQMLYYERFKKYIEDGYGILSISCSSALSGSVNTSYVVRDLLLEEYPDAEIYCIDTLNSCLGEGLIALTAANMRRSGKSLQEVAEWIEANKLKVNQVATVESLEYLKRAGRVKTSSAFFGNIFGVKPIIISDAIGNNYAFKKVKGRKNSFTELVSLVNEYIENSENQTILLGHADCIEDAETIKEMLLANVKCQGVYIDYIGPIIGASTGPGTIGIYFFGKEVTIVGEK